MASQAQFIMGQFHELQRMIENEDENGVQWKQRIAQYPGKCKSTGKKIKPGDKIAYCPYPGINGWILVD